jgi:hypothetical protein
MIKGMHQHALDFLCWVPAPSALTRGEQPRSGHSQTNARFLAAKHIYSLIFAVSPRDSHCLPGAARPKCYWWRRWYRRTSKKTGRTSMYPIPGNIICACVYPVRDRLPDVQVYVGLAIKWPPEEASDCRKESPYISSVVVMRRSVVTRRMHRRRASTRGGCAKLPKCLVGGKGNCHAEKCYECRIHSIRHRTLANFEELAAAEY